MPTETSSDPTVLDHHPSLASATRPSEIGPYCHCGYIIYEAEIDPEKLMIRHCSDCQTLSGSAFRTVV
jgi:hypothetical protein